MYSSSINNLEPFKSHTCIDLFDFNCIFALLVLLLYTCIIQLINSSYTFTTCIVELGIDTQTQMLLSVAWFTYIPSACI